MFYFLLRYPVNYGTFMDAIQEFYLRQWYRSEPVSTKEILRNDAIAFYQGRRNPLVDHPEFIDRIAYFRSGTPPPQNPDIAVSPAAVNFGAIAPGDSAEWHLLIMNAGIAPRSISALASWLLSAEVSMHTRTPSFLGTFLVMQTNAVVAAHQFIPRNALLPSRTTAFQLCCLRSLSRSFR